MRWLLTALFVLTCSIKAQTFGDFSYTLSNNKITITGYSGFGGNVVIPSSINSYPVIALAGSAEFGGVFNGKFGVNSISIPSSVTNLQAFAFLRCASLTNISVDPANNAYSSLGGVLYDKNQTTLIAYPTGRSGAFIMSNSASSIGPFAFYESAVTSVVLSNSIGTLGASAFARCFNLTNINLGSGLWKIGDSAFWTCSQLTTITIPSSVVIIGGSVFYSTGLTNISLPRQFWTNLATIGVHPNTFISSVKASDLSSTYSSMQTSGMNLVLSNPNNYQLFTSNQIINLKVGSLVLGKTNDSITLNYKIQQSTDLANWLPYSDHSLTISNAPADKMFLRLMPNQ